MKNIISLIIVAVVATLVSVNNVFAQEAAPAAPVVVTAPAADAAPVADESAPATSTSKEDWRAYVRSCEPTSVGQAFVAYCVGTLICALIFAGCHWLGSFLDPTWGCGICCLYLLYQVYNVCVQIYCGCVFLPIITIAAVGTAAYFHFTKTMAIA